MGVLELPTVTDQHKTTPAADPTSTPRVRRSNRISVPLVRFADYKTLFTST